jgi:catechol 2,3-dioxygenase-like lactoylglutathione lyase family enzyme
MAVPAAFAIALPSRGMTRVEVDMSGLLRSVAAVRIFVDELERAQRFYRDVLELDEAGDGPGYAAFRIGQIPVIVEAVEPDNDERDELVGRLVAVSDIAQAYTELRARGVMFLGPPERQDWGGTLAFARDPDANVLTLVEFGPSA